MFCFPKWRLMTRVLGSGLIGITILYSGSLIRIGSGTFATFARLFILGGGAKDAQRRNVTLHKVAIVLPNPH